MIQEIRDPEYKKELIKMKVAFKKYCQENLPYMEENPQWSRPEALLRVLDKFSKEYTESNKI